MRRDPARVKLLQPPQLICLQPGRISNYVFYCLASPLARIAKNGNKNGQLPQPVRFDLLVWMKLEKERCEQWVSDARMMPSIVLGDFASLIRLSITIVSPQAAEPSRTFWQFTSSFEVACGQIIAQQNSARTKLRSRDEPRRRPQSMVVRQHSNRVV